jgi:hypothetical protein
MFTDVSKVPAASIIRVTLLEAPLKRLPDYTAKQPERQPYSLFAFVCGYVAAFDDVAYELSAVVRVVVRLGPERGQ